jgi:hypothetical protein
MTNSLWRLDRLRPFELVRGGGPDGQQSKGILRRRSGLRGVGEEALARVEPHGEGLERWVEVTDDRVVDELHTSGVDPYVVGAPASPEVVAAGGQLSDQVG